MQVMERMVERYLSMAHPLRRYEFMSQIKVGGFVKCGEIFLCIYCKYIYIYYWDVSLSIYLYIEMLHVYNILIGGSAPTRSCRRSR
jgi:hypothetical protein